MKCPKASSPSYRRRPALRYLTCMANPTFKPVELCLHPPGGYREIADALDAANALLELWPADKQEGPAFERACILCREAIGFDGSPEALRAALLAAAEAAGIMCRQAGYEGHRGANPRKKP